MIHEGADRAESIISINGTIGNIGIIGTIGIFWWSS